MLARLHASGVQIVPPRPLVTSVGVPVRLSLTLFKQSRFLTARDVLVHVGEGRRASAAVGLVRSVPAGGTALARTLPRFATRGRRSELRVELRSSWPLGLFQERRQYRLPADVLVLPRVARLRELAGILAHVQGALEDATSGSLGEGEYYGLRQWRDGESLRGVAWKVSARRGRRLLRELRSADRPALVLHLCVRTTRVSAIGRTPSFERAVTLTSSLAEHFLYRGHRVELAFLGERSEKVGLARGRVHLLPLLTALAEVQCAPGDAALDLARMTPPPPGTLAVIIAAGGGAARAPGTLVIDVDDERGVALYDHRGARTPSPTWHQFDGDEEW
jgi:uncharacterized protein (DUF58 family)